MTETSLITESDRWPDSVIKLVSDLITESDQAGNSWLLQINITRALIIFYSNSQHAMLTYFQLCTGNLAGLQFGSACLRWPTLFFF